MTHVKICDCRIDIMKFIDPSADLLTRPLDLNNFFFLFWIYIMDKYYNGQFNYHLVAIRTRGGFFTIRSLRCSESLDQFLFHLIYLCVCILYV